MKTDAVQVCELEDYRIEEKWLDKSEQRDKWKL